MTPLTVLATSPDPIHPDLGPGAGQRRDDALDAEARQGTPAPLPADEPEGERRAAGGLAASIAAARDVVIERELQPVTPVLEDPLARFRRLG